MSQEYFVFIVYCIEYNSCSIKIYACLSDTVKVYWRYRGRNFEFPVESANSYVMFLSWLQTKNPYWRRNEMEFAIGVVTGCIQSWNKFAHVNRNLRSWDKRLYEAGTNKIETTFLYAFLPEIRLRKLHISFFNNRNLNM